MRTSHWLVGAALVLVALALTLTVDPLGLMTQGVDEEPVGYDLGSTDRAAGGLTGRGTRALPDADPATWEGEPVGRLVLSLGKAELTGTVTSAERPLRFARVRVALPPPYHEFGVRTRKDGTWAVAGLPDGTHEVRASATGHRARTVVAPPVAGAQEATVPAIDLQPRPENRNGIVVKVTDVFGRPLPGARVLATTLPWDIHLAMGPEVTGAPHVAAKRGITDETGKVRLAPLEPDDYAVVAMAPGYINAAVDKVVVAGNRERAVAVQLVEGVSVRGRVLDADGQGLANALVMGFAQPSFAASLSVRTEEDGTFLLDGLRKGPYMFIAWHETGGQTMQPGASPGSVEIKLAGTGTIRGTVRTRDGTAVTEGHVRPFKIGPFQYAYSMVTPLDEEGRFEVEVPPGRWNCRVQGADGSVSDGTLVAVTAGEVSTVEIELVQDRIVRGVVMDEDGNHVEGADVFVMQGGFPETPSREQYARTDAEGRFEVPGLPDGTIDLHVVHGDYADTKVRAEAGATGETRELSVRLKRGASVLGRVTDSEGRGVPGEQVNIAMGWFDARSVYTDADGAYRFDAVTPGEYSVTTGPYERDARGLTKRGVQVGETGEVRVDFQDPSAGGRVGGLVTRGGVPVAGARITVTDARGPERAVATVTGEDGRFLAEGVQFGAVRIEARTPDGFRADARTTVPEGDTPADVAIDIGTASVEARVLDLAGEPASGCWISLENANATEDAGWGRVVDNGNTGADGIYRARGIQPGRYTLRVNRVEFAQLVTAPFEVRAGEHKVLGDLRMQAGVVLKGVVKDDAGNPVEKATVSLCDLQGTPIQLFSMATSGSDGRYALHGIEPGRYLARVQARGHGTAEEEVRVTDSGATLDATLARGGTVTVRVTDRSGAPLAGAAMVLHDDQGRPVTRTFSLANLDTGRRRTGADGRTSLADLAAGTYTVHVTLDGHAPVGAPPRVRVEPGGTASATVELEKLP